MRNKTAFTISKQPNFGAIARAATQHNLLIDVHLQIEVQIKLQIEMQIKTQNNLLSQHKLHYIC